MKLTQNKAQKSELLDKMGFDLHPHTQKKGTLKRWKKIQKEEDPYLAIAIFSQVDRIIACLDFLPSLIIYLWSFGGNV